MEDFAELKIFDAKAVTGVQTVRSLLLPIGRFSNVGFEVEAVGLSGQIYVVASNSWDPRTETGNIIRVSLIENPPALAGGTNKFLVEYNQCPYKYVGVEFDNTSGAGTLDIWAFAKGL